MSSSFSGNPNNFLPTTFIIPTDPDEKDLKIGDYLNDIAVATNSKDSGLYDSVITVTGGLFLPTFSNNTGSNVTYRSIYRKVIDFGTLPNTATKSVAHGIVTGPTYSLVRLYGAATQPAVSTWASVIPLPYASPTLALNISLNADATNINITTAANYTAYTIAYVVIEYIVTD